MSIIRKLAQAVMLLSVILFAAPSWADAVMYDAECWANGNKLRQAFTDPKNHLVGARLLLDFAKNEEGEVTQLKEYLGHVEIAYTDSKEQVYLEQAGYYAHFRGEEHPVTLSPRAKKYPDSKYYRFKDFDDSVTSSNDGGGMWGYLVVSKDLDKDRFNAHYVFQAGDHMGGTIDFTCSGRW